MRSSRSSGSSHNNDSNATPRHHPHVELVIETIDPTNSESGGDEGDVLFEGCAVTANGRMLPSWAADAYLCDCVLHKVLRTSSGTILDYGHVHKYNWHIALDTDTGRATFTLPNGTVMISEPPQQPTIRAA